jgi:hypothetical protein
MRYHPVDHFHDGGSKYPWNADKFLLNYTALQPRRQPYSTSLNIYYTFKISYTVSVYWFPVKLATLMIRVHLWLVLPSIGGFKDLITWVAASTQLCSLDYKNVQDCLCIQIMAFIPLICPIHSESKHFHYYNLSLNPRDSVTIMNEIYVDPFFHLSQLVEVCVLPPATLYASLIWKIQD